MTTYVLGFMFDNAGQHVALIEKQHPEWQKGNYNGIGGKINPFELPEDAMQREFLEETGVYKENYEWTQFAIMQNDPSESADHPDKEEWKVYCFKTYTDDIFKCKTTEEEKIQIFDLHPERNNEKNLPKFPDLDGVKIISNLSWLIPMSQENNFNCVTINYK